MEPKSLIRKPWRNKGKYFFVHTRFTCHVFKLDQVLIFFPFFVPFIYLIYFLLFSVISLPSSILSFNLAVRIHHLHLLNYFIISFRIFAPKVRVCLKLSQHSKSAEDRQQGFDSRHGRDIFCLSYRVEKTWGPSSLLP
jgi:hypothetical protein